jgi:hypothetical protein
MEKVNDQNFFLGLRKNDLYYEDRIIVPAASDSLMQTASSGTIVSALDSLRDEGVISVEVGETLETILLVDTMRENSSIMIPGSADNATTHVGSFYAGSDQDVYVTDMRSDGRVRYDTVVIGGVNLTEGSVTAIGGRNFTVQKIEQEKILLLTEVGGGYLLPQLDGYHSELATTQLGAAGIKFEEYSEIIGGGLSSIEYTLFSREADKFRGQLNDLSIKKVIALRDEVSYPIAKAALAVDLDFHISIVRKADRSVVLDYGLIVPADTETAEREVNVESVPCIVVIDVWRE